MSFRGLQIDIIKFRILKVSKSQLIFSVLLEIIDYIQLFHGFLKTFQELFYLKITFSWFYLAEKYHF